MEGAWLGPGSCVPGRSEQARAGSEGMEPEGLSENDTVHMLVTKIVVTPALASVCGSSQAPLHRPLP